MISDSTVDEIAALRQEVRRLRMELSRTTPSLEMLLRRRGFRVHKKEPLEDLLIPQGEFRDDYYRILQKYSFRLLLRDIIKYQDFFTAEQVTRFSTADVAAGYLSYLLSIRLIVPTRKGYTVARKPVKSFGTTLEWFIAELMEREFSAESLWGVKFKRPKIGGDYDVISKLNGAIAYIEVKSSPPKQIYAEEIAAFISRVEDLRPEIAVFFMDTELRMKDKIIPMFEQQLIKSGRSPEIARITKELFRLKNKIFVINAKDSVIANLERVLYSYWRGYSGSADK